MWKKVLRAPQEERKESFAPHDGAGENTDCVDRYFAHLYTQLDSSTLSFTPFGGQTKWVLANCLTLDGLQTLVAAE